MKPILFNTDMIRAILDGRKTVTRRVVKPHNSGKAKRCEYRQGKGLWFDNEINKFDKDTHIKDYSISPCWIGTSLYIQKFAPYHPGDILYVRETWKIVDYLDGLSLKFKYAADGEISDFIDFTSDRLQKFLKYIERKKWCPALFMPREAARIFLRVTDVRLEHLRDITVGGVSDEGTPEPSEQDWLSAGDGAVPPFCWFARFWDRTIKPADRDLYGWKANPWVWVIKFERLDGKT